MVIQWLGKESNCCGNLLIMLNISTLSFFVTPKITPNGEMCIVFSFKVCS